MALEPDPGLQPERTSLSWTRTAGSMLPNAVICLRVGYTSESLPVMGLSCALLVAAGLPDGAVDISAIRLVTAATLMAALTGLSVVRLEWPATRLAACAVPRG